MKNMTVKSTKKPQHYVNNADFLKALSDYQEKCKEYEAQGKEQPRVPDYIGECLYNIATRLSFKHNFSNYPFREEMVGDGIENCLVYLNNFDKDKYSNPFAYFTQIIWYAFLRRIQKEKKQLYIKHKVLEREILHMGVSEFKEEDEGVIGSMKIDNDFITNFVDDFESKLTEKKKAGKNKRKKQEIDDDHE